MHDSQVSTSKNLSQDRDAECIACGYDLRCNPAGICPECGGDAEHRQRLRDAELRKLTGTQVGFVVAGWLIVLPMLVGVVLLVSLLVAAMFT